MNKKFISAIMAGACALSCMSISAFADDAFVPVVPEDEMEQAGQKTYEMTVGFEAPAINVTLPTTMTAVLNPYGVQIELEDIGKTSKDGVTSPVYTIANNTTDFGIIVKATAKGTDGTGDDKAEIASSGSLGNDTGNKVYATVKASINKEIACADTSTKIVFKTSGATAQQLLVLTKASKPEKKVVPVEGYFQIGGEISGKPTKAWNAVSSVKLDLILDIEAASADDGGAAATTAIGTGA